MNKKDISVAEKKTVAVAGLGNVGGTVLTALSLYPQNETDIETILIYDIDEKSTRRWEMECSQIRSLFSSHPRIKAVRDPAELFNSHIFAFCVSSGVPNLGREKEQDVRLVQFEENSKILARYLNMASSVNYGGIFAVVSDPVDHLTRFAIEKSAGKLSAEQFIGLGLGVMYARARYLYPESINLELFGTHGNLLEVVNDPESYDPVLSDEMSRRVKDFNLEVRKLGYKPYIAPAISSGALSIIAILKGRPFYGAVWDETGVWGSKIAYRDGKWKRLFIPKDPKIAERISANKTAIGHQYRKLIFDIK